MEILNYPQNTGTGSRKQWQKHTNFRAVPFLDQEEVEHTLALVGSSKPTCTAEAQQARGALAHLPACPVGSLGCQRPPSGAERPSHPRLAGGDITAT